MESESGLDLVANMSADIKIHVISCRKLHREVRDVKYLETAVKNKNGIARNLHTLCMWLNILHCASILNRGHVQWDW
jgi:hypothetical protein